MKPGAGNLLWSVRRELWEHRSVYLAPLAVAALVIVGFLFGVRELVDKMHALSLEPGKRAADWAVVPYSIAASVVFFTCFLVGVFYCLDALNGERRDRSILFWKSMPVSDRTTVIAKALVPLAVLPLLAIVIALATQALMLLTSSAILLAYGLDASMQWTRLPWFPMSVAMFYGLVVQTLWFAPVYAWLLLVSGWARRAPFLWAVLPVLAAMVVEKFAFDSGHFASLVKYRIVGAMGHSFAPDALNRPITKLSQLTPLEFLRTPGLWAGLAFAAAFIALAVWLRRRREPL